MTKKGNRKLDKDENQNEKFKDFTMASKYEYN